MKKELVVMVVAVACFAGVAIAQETLKATIKVGTGVENREIAGEATSFGVDVGRVYCWSVLEGAQSETSVKHEWSRGTEKMSEVSLAIKYPRHRTWSSKTITPEMAGEWTVKVIDADGNVLSEAKFSVGSSSVAQ